MTVVSNTSPITNLAQVGYLLRNEANFWLSDTVYAAFLKEAGEV